MKVELCIFTLMVTVSQNSMFSYFPLLVSAKNFRFSVKFLLAPGINQKHFQTYDSENLIIFLKWAY